MKIKQKIHIGFGLLFTVVLFFGALSLFYIRAMTNSNNVILQDNYATLRYIDQMRSVLEANALPFSASAARTFGVALSKQQANITEPGERPAVEALEKNFDDLKDSSQSGEQTKNARIAALKNLRAIAKLNLDAVERKSAQAKDRIRNATIFLGGAAFLTFVVLFSFVFNLAGFFEAPLQQVASAMQQVARAKTFQTRLDFDRNDEFGEISASFNEMTSSLYAWDRERSTELATQRMWTDMLGQQIADPLIIVNESQEIVFSNPPAQALFNLKPSRNRNTGRPAQQIPPPLQAGKAGAVTIGAAPFNLEIYELLRGATVPDFDSQEAPINTGKNPGKMYILRKVSD